MWTFIFGQVRGVHALAIVSTTSTRSHGIRTPKAHAHLDQASLAGRHSRQCLSTGPQAESLAAHLGARAFCSGTTIGFARGAFTPNTFAGRWLLAHELAHVNQDADQASGVVRRAPPTEDQASTAHAVASELVSMARYEAQASIHAIDRLDRLRKVRDAILAYPKSFVRDEAHMTFLLVTLDERAIELIASSQAQSMTDFLAKVGSMTKGKGSQLQASDVEFLNDLLDGMSTRTIKRLEHDLVLWPKAGSPIRMRKILELVTARTRKSDTEESTRGRFDDESGAAIRRDLQRETEDPMFAGNKCLTFLDTVGVDALFPGQSVRLAAANKEYRKLSNRNATGLHSDATLSRLAAELRIQDLVGAVNVLAWNTKHERHEPPPHEFFDRLSNAGDGWYFFLSSVASFHTILVAVRVVGGKRTYFEIDNHDVISKAQAGIDESFDSFGRFKKVPSRVWQVYVQPAI